MGIRTNSKLGRGRLSSSHRETLCGQVLDLPLGAAGAHHAALRAHLLPPLHSGARAAADGRRRQVAEASWSVAEWAVAL